MQLTAPLTAEQWQSVLSGLAPEVISAIETTLAERKSPAPRVPAAQKITRERETDPTAEQLARV